MSKNKNQKSSHSSPGSNITVVVLGVSSSEEAINVDKNVSNVDDRVLILSSSVEPGELKSSTMVKNEHLEELLSQNEDGMIAFVDAKQTTHLHTFIHSVRQRRNQLDSNHIYLTDSKVKGQKMDLRRGWFNWATRLLTPVEARGAETGFAILSAAHAKSSGLLDAIEVENPPCVYRVSQMAVLRGIPAESVQMTKAKDKQFKPSIFLPIGEFFRTRINWFIISPLKGPKNWANGNSGIYRLIFGALCLFSLVILPMLSFDYGATWDEPEDIKYFQEVISYFQTSGEDARALDTTRKLHNHLVNYGPFVNLLTATVNEYLSPFDIYETRHIVISMFALIGLIFTGLIARKLGNWRLAVLGFLLLLLTPTIFGHSFNNQKDIPFLAFYMASIYYIIRFVEDLPKVRLKSSFMLALTMGILMSIRVGGLLVFAYLIMFAGLKFLFTLKEHKSKEVKHLFSYLKPGIIVLVAAYVVGILFWPAALKDPIHHPLNALQNFEKFSFVHIFEIFEGKRFYMKSFPWYYGPKLILITIPLFVLAGLALFLVFIKKAWKTMPRHILAIAGFTFLFPLAYIIYKESALYNGWRHLLFVYPPLVVLAAAGWEQIFGSKLNKGIRIGAAVVLLALIGKTTFWMVKNHPYEYVYYNELVGGVKGAYGNYETDYWCQAPREAMKWLVENEDLDSMTTVVSNNEIISLQYYADKYQKNGEELRKLKREENELRDELDKIRFLHKEKKMTDQDFEEQEKLLKSDINSRVAKAKELEKVKVIWSRDQQWNQDPWDYAIWTTRTLNKTQLKNGYFPPKGTIHTVEVDGVPLAAIVKRENFDMEKAYAAIKKQRFDSALIYFDEYSKYDPLEEEAYTSKAQVLMQMGKNKEAIEAANKGIELRPENYLAYYWKGLAQMQLKQMDSAKISLEKAVGYKENFNAGYRSLGDILLNENNAYSAIEYYKKSESYGGANYLLYYNMGIAYLNLGDREKAANYFYGSAQLNKNFPQPYMQLYQIYNAAGNKAQAQKFLQQYQQMTGQR